MASPSWTSQKPTEQRRQVALFAMRFFSNKREDSGTTSLTWSRDVAQRFRGSLSVAGTFVSRCLTNSTMLCFHIPLIEPDGRFSRIRLSEKGSRCRPRKAASPLG